MTPMEVAAGPAACVAADRLQRQLDGQRRVAGRGEGEGQRLCVHVCVHVVRMCVPIDVCICMYMCVCARHRVPHAN